MTKPLELSLSQKFESEKLSRFIDEATSIDDLKKMSKLLLQAWMTQKAACQWVMKQSLSRPSTINPNSIASLIENK